MRRSNGRIESTALTGVLEISWVVNDPKLILVTPLLLVRMNLARTVQLVFLLIGGYQTQHVDAQSVNRFPRVETLRVSFLLDKDLKLMLSHSGVTTAFQQGSAYAHPNPPTQVESDRSGDYAHVLAAAFTAAVQTQAENAALNRSILDLESQVSRMASELQDAKVKDRQGYDHLKLRSDILERPQARSPPRSPSPIPSPRSYTGSFLSST